MGSADVVPGVSGGTIALLVGVYERLINAIRAIASPAFKEIFKKGGIPRLWKAIDGNFLLALVAGIATAIFLFSRLILSLIEHCPIQVWSVFFGLILASIWLVGKTIERWNFFTVIMLIAGTLIGYLISTAAGGSLPDGSLGLVLAGAIAICAMILPGISGSFILLLLDKYHLVMDAVSTLNFAVLIPFALGAVGGLLAFSHFLGWLLKRFHAPTIALLTGFMAGAIIKVWPWRHAISEGIDRAVLPATYTAETGLDARVGLAVLLCLVSAAFVLLMGYAAERKEKRG